MSIDSWLMLSIVMFSLSLLATTVYAIWLKKAHITDPIIVFLFFFGLFVLPLPWRTYFTKTDVGDITPHLTAILPFMPLAVFLSAAGLPFFTLAYYSRLNRHIAIRIPVPRTGMRARISAFSIGATSLILFSLLARDFGGILGFILLGYHNYDVTSGKGYLWVGLVWLPIAAEFLLYNYAVKRQKLDLLLFLLLSTCLVAMFLVLGGRAAIVYFGLTVLLFWHHAIKPLSLKKLALVGVPVFLALNLVGVLRESNYASLAEVWTKATTATPSQLEEPGTFFYTLTTGEFVVPFETFPQMIKSVGNDITPRYGLTYLESPLLVIPGVLLPERPMALENWYMQTFYGDSFSGNANRSFFFLSEGYLNFGPLGVIMTMIAWGMLLGVAEQYARRSRGHPSALLIYSLTVAFIFRAVAGYSASWISALSAQALGIACIGIWIANGTFARGLRAFLNPAVATKVVPEKL
jgi:hypothetical protein